MRKSTGSLKAFVIASLRRASYRWPPRYKVFNAARVERGKYKCNLCSTIVGRKDVCMDHIEPIVGEKGFTTWDDYINRMFVEESGWQAICRTCHTAKTNEEAQTRRSFKKKLKS